MTNRRAYVPWTLYAAPLPVLLGLLVRGVPGASFLALLLWAVVTPFLALYGLAALLCRSARWGAAALAARRVLQGLLVAAALSFVVVEGLIFSGARSDPEEPVDAVLILGAGLRGETPSLTLVSRLDAALIFLESHPGIPVIVSGGQGPGEDIPEAEAMARYLTARGVAPERIYREDASTDTKENIALSKALFPEGAARVAVVSNEFHLYRARILMRREGLIPVAVAAETPRWYLKLVYYLREYASVVFMLFG